MKYATLRLSQKDDHNRYFDLKFKLLDNHFVTKWIDRVLEAQQNQYPISEPWALYNINCYMNEKFILENLNNLIKKVDQVEPLFGFSLNNLSDQDALNKIHSIFEKQHGKLDEWKHKELLKSKPKDFRKNLSEINQFVHACEGLNGTPKIRIVWFDLPKRFTFTYDDYKLFTNQRNFGSLYHLYADVGKNIESLADDNDVHHHDVVPNIHYSADCVVYFCDDDEILTMNLEKKYKEYISKNKKYLESKGYSSEDPRLTTGRIEIARLQTDLSQNELLEKIKPYNHIQSFFLS